MIPQSFIQDLLGRVDIVEVIDRHVKLRKAGANYAACCPFHGEKTPSFTVSPTKQFYHCFGCGAHGSAIGFLMEYAGLGFVDAVKDLAQAVGMTIPEASDERARTPREGPDLHEILLKAAKYYRDQLRAAPQAIAYLKNRGITGEVAKAFGIGYAPEGWQNLGAVFADYDSSALVAAGLVIHTDDGKRYDRFRDRVMFPIVDARSRIIGFGGRVLPAGKSAQEEGSEAIGPKYLNSPETTLFEKGRELYGLFQARRAIRQTGRVLVVEGYMDVVALHQHGIDYAVATLGTATTPVHVQKLLRQADEIVFSFDGDAAGRRAAWRALENSLPALADGKQVKFLFLPEGEDPDTYVRRYGQAGFEQSIVGARPLSEFLIAELASRTDVRTHEGRATLLAEAKPLVRQIGAPMLSLLLRKALADRAGITQDELDRVFEIRTSRTGRAPARPAPHRAIRSSYVLPLLQVVMASPPLASGVDRRALDQARELPEFEPRELDALERVLDAVAANPHIRSFSEHFRDTEDDELIRQAEANLLAQPEVEQPDEVLAADFQGAWGKFMAQLSRQRLLALTRNPAQTDAVRREILELHQIVARRSSR